MKNEKVNNWIQLAERDLLFAKENINKANFRSYSPHFCHQAVEKLLKAIIVNQRDTAPPYTHNLVRLANLAELKMDANQQDILAGLNPHYVGTKYPEDIAKMFQLYDAKKVKEIYSNTEEIFQWLKAKLK